MKPETTTRTSPIGLYYDPESKQYMTAQEPAAADALVRLGFKLEVEGEEAGRYTQKDIDKLVKENKES